MWKCSIIVTQTFFLIILISSCIRAFKSKLYNNQIIPKERSFSAYRKNYLLQHTISSSLCEESDFKLHSTTPTESPSVTLLPAELATSRKVFIGNMPFKITEEEVENFARNVIGSLDDLESINIPRGKKSKKGLGFVFLDFKTHADAVKAVDLLHGSNFQGRKVNSNLKEEIIEEPLKKGKRVVQNSIYLANLEYSLTEEEIITMCNDILGDGQNLVVSIEMPVDINTGEPRGFAYIEFSESSIVQKAIEELNNVEVLGHLLMCTNMRKIGKKIGI